MSELRQVPFHGTRIIVTDDQLVALRPVCEAMGLDHSGQRQRLQRMSWAVGGMTPTTGADGKTYEMFTVDRRTFTMWLATIETGRLKNERARRMVELFQREAADALDRYFNEGGAINPRANEHQVNAMLRQAQMQMELCQAARGIIHPDHLEARARIILARAMGEAPQLNAGARPLYVQDYLREKNLSADRLRRVAGAFGKKVKASYIARYGRAPEQYLLNLSNGQVKSVNAYTEADRDLMDDVWASCFDPQGVLS